MHPDTYPAKSCAFTLDRLNFHAFHKHHSCKPLVNSSAIQEEQLLSCLRQYFILFGQMPDQSTIANELDWPEIAEVSMQIARLIAKGKLRQESQGAYRLIEKEELLLHHCKTTYPLGRMSGNYWICGPNPRTALHFVLSGPNTGFFDPVSGKGALLSDDLQWTMTPQHRPASQEMELPRAA